MGDAGIGDRQGCTGGIRLLYLDGRRCSIRTGGNLQNVRIGAGPSPLAVIAGGLRNTIGGSHGEVRIAIGLFGGSTGDLNRDRCLVYGYRNVNAGNCMVVRIAGRVGCLKGMLAHTAHTLCVILPGPAGGQRHTGEGAAVDSFQIDGEPVLRCGLCNAILHAGGLGIFTLAQRDAGGILARIGGGIGGIIIGSIPAGVRHRDVVHRNALPIVGSYRRRLGTAVINCIGCGNRHAAADPVLQRAAALRARGGDGRTVRRVAPAVLVQAEEELAGLDLADHILAAVVAGEDGAIVQVRVVRTGGKPNQFARRGRCRYGDADAGILRQALIDGDFFIFG